uniref:type IV pilus biogenesis protein PilP n=1 Tax=Burkholderia arboris TaxID=488730 RepID=UPI003BEEB637
MPTTPSYLSVVMACALSLATTGALAQTPASAPAPASAPMAASTPVMPSSTGAPGASTAYTTADLAALTAQNAVLSLKAANAELEQRIRKAKKDDNAKDDGSSASGTPGLNAALPSGSFPGAALGLPSMRVSNGFELRSITAFDGRYRAVIEANGRVYDVAAGDRIDGGWVVRSIGDTRVTLANGKKSRTIEY